MTKKAFFSLKDIVDTIGIEEDEAAQTELVALLSDDEFAKEKTITRKGDIYVPYNTVVEAGNNGPGDIAADLYEAFPSLTEIDEADLPPEDERPARTPRTARQPAKADEAAGPARQVRAALKGLPEAEDDAGVPLETRRIARNPDAAPEVAEAPKRTRRTKAQIEADKKAEEEEAAERREASLSSSKRGGEEDDTIPDAVDVAVRRARTLAKGLSPDDVRAALEQKRDGLAFDLAVVMKLLELA